MEKLVIATAFSTIISLIGQYKNEKKGEAQLTIDDFNSWLQQNRHTQILELLQLNTKAVISVKSILNLSNNELRRKIESVEKAIVAFASSLDDFNELANAIAPKLALSKQAVNLLIQIEKTKASNILVTQNVDGIKIIAIGDCRKTLAISETRFILDDLRILEKTGMLIKGINQDGELLYTYTRVASALACENITDYKSN